VTFVNPAAGLSRVLTATLGMRITALFAFARNRLAPLLQGDADHRPDLQGPLPLELFDAAVLLPYFAVMIVLALYGVHRYTMCYLYFKYRKNYNPNPPGTSTNCRW